MMTRNQLIVGIIDGSILLSDIPLPIRKLIDMNTPMVRFMNNVNNKRASKEEGGAAAEEGRSSRSYTPTNTQLVGEDNYSVKTKLEVNLHHCRVWNTHRLWTVL